MTKIIYNKYEPGFLGSVVTRTGDTNEVSMKTYTIPANALGVNGRVRIRASGTILGTNNTKTIRIRFGGLSGTLLVAVVEAAGETNEWVVDGVVQNMATNSEQFHGEGWNGTTRVLGQAPSIQSIDTTATVDVLVSGQLGNAADSIVMRTFAVEIAKQ